MRLRRFPKTDLGTVVLHWSCVSLFGILVATGLRIASDEQGFRWLGFLDNTLISEDIWFYHMIAGWGLSAVAIAYAGYISNARLFSRIKLDRIRIIGLFGPLRMRLASLNVLGYWWFFGALITNIITGWMAYFEFREPCLSLHFLSAGFLLVFPVLHVITQMQIGGIRQLLRIFRPTTQISVNPPLDLAGLVAELLEAQQRAERQQHGVPRSRTFQPEGLRTDE